MLPKLQLAICDVRDVAAAHIKSLTLPDAPGMYASPHLHYRVSPKKVTV